MPEGSNHNEYERVTALSDKIRLDVAVFERGLAETREKAKAMIMAGSVYVNGVKALKGGAAVKAEDEIEVRGSVNPYVSRGGLKLAKAMKSFDLSLDGLKCMDIGASTGGFTDCMLQNGAVKVYAIDVGYGQLAWKLRTDERVVNLERTNFRYCTREQVPEEIDFASVDVSFISLKKILPVMATLLGEEGRAVCLIKPQFEAGREHLNKKGVVKDKKVHAAVIEDIRLFALESGFSVLGADFSPVKGPEGNIEYLLYIQRAAEPQMLWHGSAAALSDASHEALDKDEKAE